MDNDVGMIVLLRVRRIDDDVKLSPFIGDSSCGWDKVRISGI
jgi:hypothetical protein